ncbi:MAG: hypothetical protein IRZ26_03930 [Clostridia bacterium]|nr:hypothetical protein [Clostridia bacterium]
MNTYVIEFPDRAALDRALEHLWERLKISGELNAQPVGGRWRLEVTSEKPLRAGTLEKLGGKLLG